MFSPLFYYRIGQMDVGEKHSGFSAKYFFSLQRDDDMDNWLLKILHSTKLGMPNVIVFARLASCVKKTRMAFERFYGCPTDKGLFGHGDCWERAVGSALECPTKCLEKTKEKRSS